MGLFLHCHNILGVPSHPILSNNVTEVFELWDPKSTFGAFNEHLMIMKELHGFINMLYTRIPSFIVNQNVIKENQHKIMKIWPQNFIYEALKSRGSITKSKGNYQKHVIPFMFAKSCLWNIDLFHLDLVVLHMNEGRV